MKITERLWRCDEVAISGSLLKLQDEYQTISPCINRLDVVKNAKSPGLFQEVHIWRSFNTCFGFYRPSITLSNEVPTIF